MTSEAELLFTQIATTSPRCVWIDGDAAAGWGGKSTLAWLDEDDVSLTYDATAATVTLHQSGSASVVGTDIFEVLSRLISTGPPEARWFGYFGYASRPDLPARPSEDLPDAVWMRPSNIRVISGFEPPTKQPSPSAGDFATLDDPDAYAAAFATVQERLRAGDSYEVNLTYRARFERHEQPLAVYTRLRALNGAAYSGFLQHDVEGARAWLLSSSPECYARIDANRRVTSRPIKGTTPRGTTEADDLAQAQRLLTDPRFRSENLMIVDLLRNDLATVCDPGTVAVAAFQRVTQTPSVHQLYSTVLGRLREDVTSVDALRALFPPGSMTGAPKLRTMQIVEEVEWSPRGAYSGAFGHIDASGEADLAVIIRSLFTTGDGQWSLGTGGGITVYSPLDEELAEAGWKAARLVASLAPTQQR